MKQKLQGALTLKEHKHTCKFYIHIVSFSYKKWKYSIKLKKSSSMTFLNHIFCHL